MVSLDSCISSAVLADRDRHGAVFAAAEPFRHVVLDDFLAPDFLAALDAEFPPFEVKHAHDENGGVGGKAVVERIRAIGPAYARLDALVRSAEFLALVSVLTGIPDLLYDPHYFGGGTHENRHGQDLDPHIDFNRHPVERWHRRLNLIVYLNRDWNPAWGGALELHSDPRAADDRVVTIAPAENRCVIFETTEHSWHGFSRIALPEDQRQRTRRSIALYFYTADRPAAETADTHATVYVDRPLPAHLVAGHRLTEEDERQLGEIVARRDQHLARLYAENRAMRRQLEQAQAAVQTGLVGRLAYLGRRLAARLRR